MTFPWVAMESRSTAMSWCCHICGGPGRFPPGRSSWERITHLLPRPGDYELRAITPMAVEDFREQMRRAKVGAPTQRKALMLL